MKPEAQRIAISKACGFTKVEWYEDNAGPPILHGFPPLGVTAGKDGEWEASRPKESVHIPEYPFDLNACHEMEDGLKPDDFSIYLSYLSSVTSSEHRYEVENRFALIHATPAQRSEAFLRTLGKWEEKP